MEQAAARKPDLRLQCADNISSSPSMRGRAPRITLLQPYPGSATRGNVQHLPSHALKLPTRGPTARLGQPKSRRLSAQPRRLRSRLVPGLSILSPAPLKATPYCSRAAAVET